MILASWLESVRAGNFYNHNFIIVKICHRSFELPYSKLFLYGVIEEHHTKIKTYFSNENVYTFESMLSISDPKFSIQKLIPYIF